MTQDQTRDAQTRIAALEAELNSMFPERGQVTRGALTALIAGEHALMLGPPGTAKSLFARTISDATAGGNYFEILLTKFTTVEEVFGPVSFSALKQDRFERMTDGYAADRKVLFFDEIFKSSSAILNCFLTLMNERKYHNGGKPQATPLEMVLAASNEYPQDDSLKALYDRFLFKYWVDYIGDRDSLAGLITAGGVGTVQNKLEAGDLDALRAAVNSFAFANGDVETLLNIKAAVEAEGFTASDRTWVKAAKVIKARAVLCGRSSVSSADFMILSDILWKEHKDRDKLHTIIGNAADPYGARAEAITDAVKTAMRDLPEFSLLESGAKTKVEMIKAITDVNAQVMSRFDALTKAIDEMEGENEAMSEAKVTVESAMQQVQDLMSKVTFFRAPKA